MNFYKKFSTREIWDLEISVSNLCVILREIILKVFNDSVLREKQRASRAFQCKKYTSNVHGEQVSCAVFCQENLIPGGLSEITRSGKEREGRCGRDRPLEVARLTRKKGGGREGDGKKVEDDEKGGEWHHASEERDGATKEAEGIIIKRQGGKITYGAALASIHAFYSLAVSAHADRTTSYHLASSAPNAAFLFLFFSLSLILPFFISLSLAH